MILSYKSRIECQNCPEKSNGNMPIIGPVLVKTFYNEEKYECPKGINTCHLVKKENDNLKDNRNKLNHFTSASLL